MKQRELLVALGVAAIASGCERATMPTATPEHTVPALATTAAAPAPGPTSETTWGGAGSDVTEGAAVASDGSSYLAGFTTSFSDFGSTEVMALKFAADGSLTWQRTWDGPDQFFGDRASDVAVAPDGSVYLVGSTLGVGGDVLLLKFSPDGTLLWQKTWGGSSNEYADAVSVGADGSVYVVGSTRSFGAGEEDLFVIKVSPDGAVIWQKTWGTASNEQGQGVAVGPDGNVYVAGVAPRPDVFAWDAIVLKLDPSGALIWQRAYSAGEVADARGGLAVAADGSVYVAGGLQGPSGSGFANDALLLKLTADGNLVWDRTWGGRSGQFAEDVAVAPDGRVVFVGSTASYGQGSDDAFVLRLNPSGRTSDAFLWGGTDLDNGRGVAVAPDGTVSLGATAGAPPYVLDGAPGRTSRARGSLSTPTLSLGDASGVVSDAGGVVETPAGSTTYAGGADAALVRIAP